VVGVSRLCDNRPCDSGLQCWSVLMMSCVTMRVGSEMVGYEAVGCLMVRMIDDGKLDSGLPRIKTTFTRLRDGW